MAHLQLVVRDTGIGMDEQQRQRLFQPYTQFEGQDSELQTGTGLGLAICQQLTRLMGGQLDCTSDTGTRLVLHAEAGRCALHRARD